MSGLTAAPEKYQQIVRDVLSGYEGVANRAYDLIIQWNGVKVPFSIFQLPIIHSVCPPNSA